MVQPLPKCLPPSKAVLSPSSCLNTGTFPSVHDRVAPSSSHSERLFGNNSHASLGLLFFKLNSLKFLKFVFICLIFVDIFKACSLSSFSPLVSIPCDIYFRSPPSYTFYTCLEQFKRCPYVLSNLNKQLNLLNMSISAQ